MDVPQIRTGRSSFPRTNDKPYSAVSYAAQYGITVEEGESLIQQYTKHSEIDLEIGIRMARDPEMFQRAVNV
jgi:hypothetical protein